MRMPKAVVGKDLIFKVNLKWILGFEAVLMPQIQLLLLEVDFESLNVFAILFIILYWMGYYRVW